MNITGGEVAENIPRSLPRISPGFPRVLMSLPSKRRSPDVFNHLLQPGADGKAITVGMIVRGDIMSKDYGLVGVLFLKYPTIIWSVHTGLSVT